MLNKQTEWNLRQKMFYIPSIVITPFIRNNFLARNK